jgi:outer membrane protein insertion porin family
MWQAPHAVLAAAFVVALLAATLGRAAQPADPPPATPAASSPLAGRNVDDVRVVGNRQVPTAVILNLIRTRPGDKFDPNTVEEDYQRVYGLRKFADVEAKAEPSETGGVIVIFEVREQTQIASVNYRGNFKLDEATVSSVVDLRTGEAIDPFRVALARTQIENLYRARNFPFAHVEIDQDRLTGSGDLIFNIVEGPQVRIRKIDVVGNESFTDGRVKSQIRARSYLWLLRAGTYDPEQIEDDVASIRRFYESRGFFDVRVGRKLIFSPDNTELQVDFLVEEGRRYTVDAVTFKGNSTVSDAELRARMKLLEGTVYNDDTIRRDLREIVRAYSPYGFIYQPQSTDPNYLQIGTAAEPVKRVFRRDAGTVELVYEIREGKPFKLGRVIVKGNSRTQDKIVLRELKMAPGELYNSGAVQDAIERLRGLPFFSGIVMTPIGDDPEHRDLLVEVQEARTASFNLGAGVNSNGGFGANITYEQRNFDITNLPSRPSDIFNGNAFIGAGQSLRISLEPGSQVTNGSIRFREPYVFDQPYGLTTEAFFRDREREHYRDRRIGGRLSVDRRFFDNKYTAALSLRAETVDIGSIDDRPIRADEILDEEGDNLLTAVGIRVVRDTTNRGILPYEGTTISGGIEQFGAFGGDYTFTRFTASWDKYYSLREDLLERRTILALHLDAGYIAGDAPFFERFYGGGIGSIRGFAFRGVSPRSGPDEDRVGGEFSLTGSAEVSFPLVGEQLRGVVFTDFGTVEEDFRFGTIRSSVGTGFRLIVPFLGQTPIAIDFAVPLSKDDEDDTQIISFSLGFER